MPRKNNHRSLFRKVPAAACLWGVLSLALLLCRGEESFSPEFANPVTQDLAWIEIEEVGAVQMTCMDVGPDGTLWLGLMDGIASYNGREVTVYKEELGPRCGTGVSVVATRSGLIYFFQREGIKCFKDGEWHTVYEGRVANEATDVASEGKNGTVWVGVDGGILQINGLKVLHHPGYGEFISTAYEDHFGNVWGVVLNDGKTYRIPVQNGTLASVEHWEVMLDSTSSRPSRYSLVEESNSRIWRFSTDYQDPPKRFDPRDESWQEWDFTEFGGSNQVQGKYRTKDGIVWAVSDGVLHGYVDDEWRIHRNLSSRHGPMRASMAESPNGDLWLLDYRISLYRIDYAGSRWKTFNGMLFQVESSEGDRWFISEEGYVTRSLGPGHTHWFRYEVDDQVISDPLGLFELETGEIYALGSHDGVAALSIFDGKRWRKKTYPEFGDAIRGELMLEMEDGTWAVCSHNSRSWIPRETSGLMFLDTVRGEARVVPVEELPSRIMGMASGADGRFYVNEGVGYYRREGESWRMEKFPDGFRQFWIDDLMLDKEGYLWMANWGTGILRKSPEGEWSIYDESTGESGRFVSHFLEDDTTGALFALGNEGLSRFDGMGWFRVLGGLQLASHRNSSFLRQGKEKEIWITQGNKLWHDRMHLETPYQSPEGEAFGSIMYRMEAGGPETSIEIIHEPKTRDRGLSVRWSAKDLWNVTKLEDLRYSYRLDDGEWSEFSVERKYSFHQLDDGKHVLEVRARDADFNVDESPARYEFSIPPPIWRQSWFLWMNASIAAIILGLLGVIFRQRWRHLVEYDRQRINFFTNISHELRTPLSLILAPLEKLNLNMQDVEKKKDVALALKSANRLNQLVDQLLDFRKIESGAMEVNLDDGDIVGQMDEIVSSFLPLADTKKQSLKFKCLEDSRYVKYDQDKLQKVLANLISNALKYTPDRGVVRVTLEFLEKIRGERQRIWAVVKVEDNGRGIPPARQKLIFEPFYRGDSRAAREATGTGLGLSLTTQLVRLFGGRIELESPLVHPGGMEKGGTRFTVAFPVQEAPVEGNETAAEEASAAEEEGAASIGSSDDGQSLRILLVDDNEDLRDFIR